MLQCYSNIGDGKTQQLGPKLWEIVGEQQGILKIPGIGEHTHIRAFIGHLTKILAEQHTCCM